MKSTTQFDEGVHEEREIPRGLAGKDCLRENARLVLRIHAHDESKRFLVPDAPG